MLARTAALMLVFTAPALAFVAPGDSIPPPCLLRPPPRARSAPPCCAARREALPGAALAPTVNRVSTRCQAEPSPVCCGRARPGVPSASAACRASAGDRRYVRCPSPALPTWRTRSCLRCGGARRKRATQTRSRPSGRRRCCMRSTLSSQTKASRDPRAAPYDISCARPLPARNLKFGSDRRDLCPLGAFGQSQGRKEV